MKIKTFIPHFVDETGNILRDENGKPVKRAAFNTNLETFIYDLSPAEILEIAEFSGEGVDSFFEDIKEYTEVEQLLHASHPLTVHLFEIRNDGIYKNGVAMGYYLTSNKFIELDHFLIRNAIPIK